jgi:prepilin-type processing-associated H-X9-DG protein
MGSRGWLAVGLVVVAAVLLWTWRPNASRPVVELSDDQQACISNLRAIHAGLLAMQPAPGEPPRASGIALFAGLIAAGTWPDDAEHRRLLTCPGSNAEPVAAGTDYSALASLGPASSAYAGRDLAAHPLAAFPCGGDEALVACDGARGPNHGDRGAGHGGAINVLMADGSVRTLELERLLDAGRLPEGTAAIELGPGSPIEWLRVFQP